MTGPAGGTAGANPSVEVVPLRHPGRWVAAGVILVLVAMLVHSMVANPNWQWGVIGHYLFTGAVLDGLRLTLELTVIAMAVGAVLGTVIAVMRLSPNPIVSGAAWVYIWLLRGTPVIVQLVLWFYLGALFPTISIGIPFGPHFADASANSLITKFTAAILGLGLNEAAYMAEIVRSGIISVDAGQTEAAAALGLTRGQTMRRIVLPQAMRVIIPPTGNETISMLKTSALVYVIALSELFTTVQIIYSRTYETIPLLLVASIWYLVLTSVGTVGQFYIERHFSRGVAGGQATTPLQLLRRNLFHFHAAASAEKR